MVAPQAGQKREDGSTCLPHLEQNMRVSGRFYFATETVGWRRRERSGMELGCFRRGAERPGRTTTTTKADPYGMTNKKANGKSNSKGKSEGDIGSRRGYLPL